MLACFVDQPISSIVPIQLVKKDRFSEWQRRQSVATQAWIHSIHFKPDTGKVCLLPGENNTLQAVLLIVSGTNDQDLFSGLIQQLPKGAYQLESQDSWQTSHDEFRAFLGWGLGYYRFNRYRKFDLSEAKLLIPSHVNSSYLHEWLKTIYFVRDCINTPADDMNPEVLTDIAKTVAQQFKASIHVIEGESLLKHGFNTIYAVGRGAAKSPRLIELTWGDKHAPKLTLVGKGVCFDTGGLDIKAAENMRWMKKDMAGAAHALGLAQMIMASKMPVRLKVLLPVVENAISSRSYHPGDVIKTRAGITVEVGNTDAEGRLVLCDALAEACKEKPDCLIDFSTLTGAARVALGTDLPAFFCNNEAIASSVLASSQAVGDWVWRMPLYQPYLKYMDSDIADLSNSSKVLEAGCITAALYLQQFVKPDISWMHFDMTAWNNKISGGEAQTLRAVFHYLQGHYD